MFAALMLFNVLRMYMAMMPRAFSTVAQQQISEKRIAKFLQAEEFSVPQGTQRTEEPGLDGLGKGPTPLENGGSQSLCAVFASVFSAALWFSTGTHLSWIQFRLSLSF